jgi:hypothetical protein
MLDPPPAIGIDQHSNFKKMASYKTMTRKSNNIQSGEV